MLVELLGFLLEVLGEFLIEFVFQLAAGSLDELIEGARKRSPTSALWILAISGTGAGFLSVVLIPHRVFQMHPSFPAASLLFAPLATGCTMHFLGTLRRRFGREPSYYATFHGGLGFAFSMALIAGG